MTAQNRRSVLKGAGAIAAGLASSGLPVAASVVIKHIKVMRTVVGGKTVHSL